MTALDLTKNLDWLGFPHPDPQVVFFLPLSQRNPQTVVNFSWAALFLVTIDSRSILSILPLTGGLLVG